MKHKLFTRVSVSVLLVILALFILFKTVEAAFYTPALAIITFLASSLLIAFCIVLVVDMARGKAIAKFPFGLAVIVSAVVLLFLVWFGLAALEDLARVYCGGFFGESASCNLSAFILLELSLGNPYVIVLLGALSIPGIVLQINPEVVSRAKSKSKSK